MKLEDMKYKHLSIPSSIPSPNPPLKEMFLDQYIFYWFVISIVLKTT